MNFVRRKNPLDLGRLMLAPTVKTGAGKAKIYDKSPEVVTRLSLLRHGPTTN